MSGYFDHNATAPMTAEARAEWLRVETSHWHNPSSLYREAGQAKRLLEDLREEVADRLGCKEPTRVVFTSGATEANNAVMKIASGEPDGRILISGIEHPSVADAARATAAETAEWPISEGGELDDAAGFSIKDFSLVSVMAANNETGVMQPWKEVAERCRDQGVWFHCDAAQWIGKCDSQPLGACDFVTGCAHKFGGPKGVGFLLLPEEIHNGEAGLENISSLVGGPQENRHRAGTENLSGIAAMVAAWRQRDDLLGRTGFAEGKAADRTAFETQLCAVVEGTRVIGGESKRLWNTSMIAVPAHSNLKWLTRLSRRGFCLSTGSACSAGKGNPSQVMAAMGLSHQEMGRVLRISGGWETTAQDWQAIAAAMTEVWRELESGERIAAERVRIF
jgi:cysteine desulfurase